MKNDAISFVFFGSGPVASASLEFLSTHFTVEAVVTKSTTKTEMSRLVDEAKIYTADTKKELDDLFTTNLFSSKFGILIDFGIIVSTKIISYFPLGIINSHFSLLPELRGADPISFAILEGKTKTGVSLMLLVEAMDEGPIIARTSINVPQHTTTPELTEKLIHTSNELLKKEIPRYIAGSLHPTPQNQLNVHDKRQVSYTRKLAKTDSIIDWSKPAILLEREIRAFREWPKSKTVLSGIPVILEGATVVQHNKSAEVGKLYIENKTILVQCGEGLLRIDKLKPLGKKSMSSEAFLAGYKSKISTS